MYDQYKMARDAAWDALIRCRITRLPIDLQRVADQYRVPVLCYSDFPELSLSGDGFAVDIDGPTIYINDRIHYRPRRRFTVAHELGHVILGHSLDRAQNRTRESDSGLSPLEVQANIFARDLLMPACILAALDVHTPEDIMRICDVSYLSACIRAERLALLYRRGKFGVHPLERQVLAQFRDFITTGDRCNKTTTGG